MPSIRRTAVALVGLSLALTGCSGDDSGRSARAAVAPSPQSTFTAPPDVPVLVPGAPGEPAQTIAPGDAGTVANADYYVDADVDFVTGMVPHHAQALEMARLAEDRADDQRVRTLAERIAQSQRPEIQFMQDWLEQHDLPPADEEAHGGHGAGHAGMPGMATPEEMTRLVAAKGSAFDRLFLQLMIKHHQGALQMTGEAVDARHPLITSLADDVSVSQTLEIERMQELLASLPA